MLIATTFCTPTVTMAVCRYASKIASMNVPELSTLSGAAPISIASSPGHSCDVLLALIGDQWLTTTDANGQRRIDDPDDFVRLEIQAALTRNVLIIPILVDGAKMPRAEDLPAGLAGLARRQALELSPNRFEYDTNRLLRVLDATLAEVRTAHGLNPSWER